MAKSLGISDAAPIKVRLPGIARPVQPHVLFVSQARREIVKAKFVEHASM